MSVFEKINITENKQLLDYWNTLRKTRKAPQRFEIEPSQISHILPHTFILQHEDDDTYDFRLAGTQICHDFCFELKQKNILDLWSSGDRDALNNLLRCVVNDVAIGIIEFEAISQNGQSVSYEMVILPLYHTSFKVNRMLGGMVTTSKPYWLGISKLEKFKLKQIRLSWAEKDQTFSGNVDQFFNNNVQPLTNTDYKTVILNDRKFRVFEGGRTNCE